jgi:hypothetical protein
MSERLERVVSMQQLRPGLLLRHTPCALCRGAHDFMLLAREATPSRCMDCPGPCLGWDCGPLPHGLVFYCPIGSIAAGRLFLVDPFSEQSETTEKRREMAR